MIKIKTKEEIILMEQAGKIVWETHNYLKGFIREGISTKELDSLAHKFIISKKAYPSFKNYNGYPASICVSINDEVVHGIPGNRKLKKGDIISIDIGASYKGYHGDSAWTYFVTDTLPENKKLMEITKECLYIGLNQVRPGNKLSDISKAIENKALSNNYGVVKELVGHGVGKKLHEEPDVPNFYSKYNKDYVLKPGMVFAIEPMINLGTEKIYIEDNGWTIVTADNKPSAHYEHTVLVTDDGYKILTGE